MCMPQTGDKAMLVLCQMTCHLYAEHHVLILSK